MKTVKEIMYKTSLTFMLLIMAIMPFSASKPQLAMNSGNILLLFFMSCCIGVSFLVFKIKKIPGLAQRIIHICVCFGVSLAFFMPLSDGKSQTMKVFFLISLIFIVVYPLLMLISYLSSKLERKFGQNEDEE